MTLTEDEASPAITPDPERSVVRIPALDGIRAIAVVLVLLFHGGLSWASGGFLGVDVFFVLSGFLITGLLVSEYRQHRGIALARFWAHRVRRLLPALLVVILAVAAYARFAAPADTMGQLRGDAWATLLYVNNWHQVLGGQGYFAELVSPRPLLHAWSLSIEEQFYVLWPLIVLVVLRLSRSLRGLLATTVVGAVASAAAMAWLFEPGLGANRSYFGTDTRVQALLIGAALAIALARPLSRQGRTDPSGALVREIEPSPAGRRLLAAAGLVGLVVVLGMSASVGAATTWIYTGGFGLLALGAAAMIASVAIVPDGLLARALSLAPVRYVGAISYGLYLWHWPLYVWLDHSRTGLSGTSLLALRLGASLLAAVASYHLLEMPIRRGALPGWRGAVAAIASVAICVGCLILATDRPASGKVSSTTGLSASQRQALQDAGAFSGRPVRFMLFGDSVATTMAFGLGADSRRWGIETQFTHTDLGCDLDPEDTIVVSGKQTPATPGCRDWPSVWAKAIAAERPEVVGILLGRWEVVDRRHDGRWMHIGQAAWDDHLASQLDKAIGIINAGGAKAVLFTMPYVDPPEAADGSTYPENTKQRIDAYNRVLRRVAERNPGEVRIVDLNRIADPGGRFEAVIDGVRVRDADGIHFGPYGGLWLRPRILPAIGSIGLEARAG